MSSRLLEFADHDVTPKSARSSVILVRPHRPRRLVIAVGEGAVGLRRIAIDQRPQKHRMRGAAHLVLDGEQMSAVGRIDDIAEAVLVLIVFAGDQIAFAQSLVGAREVRDVDLDVMAVEFALRRVALAELQILILADFCARDDAIAVYDAGGDAQDLRIEPADRLSRAARTSNST
ncbi:hypothetical protein [Bradyrhizobium brasilense]|uniref:hypothetical protein n=1 Tax=Bradyrhizobium brasilense TaxID=1419277 RepID=UPI001E36B6B1|nr:hypothetical protein [Bradyrhizobium brasilense]